MGLLKSFLRHGLENVARQTARYGSDEDVERMSEKWGEHGERMSRLWGENSEHGVFRNGADILERERRRREKERSRGW